MCKTIVDWSKKDCFFLRKKYNMNKICVCKTIVDWSRKDCFFLIRKKYNRKKNLCM